MRHLFVISTYSKLAHRPPTEWLHILKFNVPRSLVPQAGKKGSVKKWKDSTIVSHTIPCARSPPLSPLYLFQSVDAGITEVQPLETTAPHLVNRYCKTTTTLFNPSERYMSTTMKESRRVPIWKLVTSTMHPSGRKRQGSFLRIHFPLVREEIFDPSCHFLRASLRIKVTFYNCRTFWKKGSIPDNTLSCASWIEI